MYNTCTVCFAKTFVKTDNITTTSNSGFGAKNPCFSKYSLCYFNKQQRYSQNRQFRQCSNGTIENTK